MKTSCGKCVEVAATELTHRSHRAGAYSSSATSVIWQPLAITDSRTLTAQHPATFFCVEECHTIAASVELSTTP